MRIYSGSFRSLADLTDPDADLDVDDEADLPRS